MCLAIGIAAGLILHFFSITTILFWIGWILAAAIVFRVVIFVGASYINYRQGLKPVVFDKNFHPLVTVMSPCYNEGPTLKNAIESLMKQTYENIEIIIVDDGSKDNTKQVGEAMAKKYPKKVRFFSKPNGGKASALNLAIAKAKGEILLSMDADAVFAPDTIKYMVSSFQNPKVMAVSGNVKVSNRDNFLTQSQSLECIAGLQLQTRAFSQLGCIQVIPGSLGAFRKWAVDAVGGYSTETIVEDMDMTISLQERFWKQGYKIVFNNRAIAYVEQPENFKDFMKQRYRWIYGWFQIQKKHKNTLFNPDYGIMGMFGFPYFVIAPWVNILMVVVVIATLALTVITGQYVTFALDFAGGSILVLLLILYAIHIDSYGEKRTISWLSVLQNIWYLFVLNYVYLKAGYYHAIGRKTGWNKMARLGKNAIRSKA
jgi:peptidoglycan-N-acetylglucosamine deacetylase